MRIVYRVNQRIGPPVWYAKTAKGLCMVTCGRKAETFDSFFAEGAWADPLSEAGFFESDWFCGSGARADADGIVFSAPNNMTSGLLCSETEDGFEISNSLYLLLTVSGEDLDPDYSGCERDFNTVPDGIDDYKSKVHVLNRPPVRIAYYRNVRVLNDGTVQIEIKPDTRPFDRFEDYEARLKKAIIAMAEIAKDPRISFRGSSVCNFTGTAAYHR